MGARFSQYVVYAREPASFWRESVVAVIILLRVLVTMSQRPKKVIKYKRFYHFATGRRLYFLQYK